ncbi:MAG: YgiT-type zinc finger protein [Planctomycetota bacterium]
MKCESCQMELQKRTSPYIVSHEGYRLFLSDVPVYVCPHCGSRYYDEAEVDAIQQMVEHLDVDFRKMLAIAG